MDLPHKKSPEAKSSITNLKRLPGAAPKFQPSVAQTKNGATTPNAKRPVAPPVYRPQSKLQIVQQKRAPATPPRTPFVTAPPAQQRPSAGVVQKVPASGSQARPGSTSRRPVAPPVYRPEAKKVLQPKIAAAAPVRPQPTPPPTNPLRLTPGVLQPKGAERLIATGSRKLPVARQAFPPSSFAHLLTTVIQRAAPKAGKAPVKPAKEEKPPYPEENKKHKVVKKKPHTTKAGKIKESTVDFLKDLPKGTSDAEVVGIWEVHKSMLDRFAGEDTDGLPPNTTGTVPQKLNLVALQADYYLLGKKLADAVAAAVNNSRGAHANDENKLPTYAGVTPYEEYGFFKGGGRLVIDHTSHRQYISLHYSIFYRVL